VPALVATTTGTPAMFAAKKFEKVYVGSFVNFSALVAALSSYEGAITLIPAAVPDWEHVEDEIACQTVATALEGFSNMPEFVRECAESGKARILASPRPSILAGKLVTGVEDVEIALEIDRVSQVLSLRFDDSVLAEVKKEN
jgi:phosphosulfolactate phosphohydrolase-like enzyme